jgi:regulator of protease activity HflC (stomatin/prohibitin superfamily)
MTMMLGISLGLLAFFVVRYLIFGIYTVDQNERAVKTVFGKAQRLHEGVPGTASFDEGLSPEEKERYQFPQLRVIGPGGPYFAMPWEKVYKVSVATNTVSMAWDPESPHANTQGTVLEAVTRDQLNTGLSGQIRYRITDRNLYAYLFAVKNPLAHVMGYFVSVLRERIANFEAPPMLQSAEGPVMALPSGVSGVSINDLRKNLRDLNDHMLQECRSSEARYGILLEASLITGIDPPAEVESALAAINTAHNHVSSDVSLAQADADQKLVQSKRAVEIETLKAQAEVEPLRTMAAQLEQLGNQGQGVLEAYLRNVRLDLLGKARRIFLEAR